MAYRDELAALAARRDALAAERAEVERALEDEAALRARARALSAEVDHRRRVTLPLLGAVTVKTPCKEPWAKMTGDDRVRHCARCDKDVYDLSALTAAEAEALLRERLGGDLCVRFFRRPDGTVLTSDCPVGARRKRRRRLVTAIAIAAGVLGGAATTAWTLIDRDEPAAPEVHEVEGAVAEWGSP